MSLHPGDVPWGASGGAFVPAPDAERNVQVRWLGTAGYELRAQGTTLLIDPYLTRVGLWPFLTRRIGPDPAAIARHVSAADAIFVSHSHFDHVLDVPHVASMTGARVYGSRSTAHLCRSSGVPEPQVVELDARGQTVEVGPFRVRAIPSEHSRFLLGRVPYPGEIPSSCELPLRGSRYRCGQVFGFLIECGDARLYHSGSANLIDDAIDVPEVDVLLLCIAGRQATERLAERFLRRTHPRRVVPMHYDNFFRPLDAGLRLLPRTAFGRLVDEFHGVDPSVEIQTIDLLGTVALAARR